MSLASIITNPKWYSACKRRAATPASGRWTSTSSQPSVAQGMFENGRQPRLDVFDRLHRQPSLDFQIAQLLQIPQRDVRDRQVTEGWDDVLVQRPDAGVAARLLQALYHFGFVILLAELIEGERALGRGRLAVQAGGGLQHLLTRLLLRHHAKRPQRKPVNLALDRVVGL